MCDGWESVGDIAARVVKEVAARRGLPRTPHSAHRVNNPGGYGWQIDHRVARRHPGRSPDLELVAAAVTTLGTARQPPPVGAVGVAGRLPGGGAGVQLKLVPEKGRAIGAPFGVRSPGQGEGNAQSAQSGTGSRWARSAGRPPAGFRVCARN